MLQDNFCRWKNLIVQDVVFVRYVNQQLKSSLHDSKIYLAICVILNFWRSDAVSYFMYVNMHQLQRPGYIYPVPPRVSWCFNEVLDDFSWEPWASGPGKSYCCEATEECWVKCRSGTIYSLHGINCSCHNGICYL